MPAVLQDLDTFTWVVTFVAAIGCGFILLDILSDRRAHRRISAGVRLRLLWIIAALSAFGAFDTINRDTTSEHRVISGSAQIMRRLSDGRHGGHRLLICVAPCASSPHLYVGPGVSNVIERNSSTQSLTIGYLFKSETVDPGIYAYEVVDVWNTGTGRSYYHFDTQPHPLRAGFLVGDTLLLLLTALFLSKSDQDSPPNESEVGASSHDDEVPATKSDLTSLDLSGSSNEGDA
jgi:hypothetical protein